MNDPKTAWKTLTDEIEVAGSQLLSEINRLIAQGNVRELRISSEDGDVLLKLPLTAGAIAGGVLALAAPWLAVLAAVAGLAAKVKIEVTRRVPDPPEIAHPTGEEPGPDAQPKGGPDEHRRP